MSKKNLVHAWKKNPEVQECSVPQLLRITLLVLRLLSAAPVQLRRVGSGWRLAAMPSWLSKVRFLFAIVLGVSVLSSMLLEMSEYHHLESTMSALTAFLNVTDQTLFMLCHVLYERYLMDNIMSLVKMLRELEKVNISLKGGWYCFTHQKIKVTLLIAFIAWNFMSFALIVSWVLYKRWNNVTKTNAKVYATTINAYLFLVLTINLLRWSVTIAEISSTITTLNSRIRLLLQQNITDPEDLYSTVRSLGQCYETLCDIVRGIENDSAMFFLVSFMSRLIKLVLTPYNFLISLDSSINNFNERFSAILQINCYLCHVISMLIIVEPCHCTRDQMAHTHDLLIRLARRTSQRHGHIFTELNLFILQVKMRGNSFTPMGIFTISRPLVATIFSIVTTYLAIVIQTKNDSES